MRRFGTWLLLEPDEVEPYLDARARARAARRRRSRRATSPRGSPSRRAPVKAAILDQRTVAGVGNIYADEALWRARIHPLREARSLDAAEVRALHRAVRRALELGIARQGSTLSRLRAAERRAGRDAGRVQGLRPRGRAVRPLRDADRADRRRAAAGTWYCPSCQVSPYADRARPRAAVAVEAHELGVAADRRSSTRICGTVQLPVSPSAGSGTRVVVEADLVVATERASSSAFARSQKPHQRVV